MGVIRLYSDGLTVDTETIPAVLAHMATIILPVLEQYPFRITNEHAHDITARYAGRMDKLFDPTWEAPEDRQARAAYDAGQRAFFRAERERRAHADRERNQGTA
jgi:hypothetical protein